MDVVVQALNGIIEIGEPGIFERKRFQDVSLRPETYGLMDEKPTASDLSRLNRLLLEDAYPSELKSQEMK